VTVYIPSAVEMKKQLSAGGCKGALFEATVPQTPFCSLSKQKHIWKLR